MRYGQGYFLAEPALPDLSGQTIVAAIDRPRGARGVAFVNCFISVATATASA